MPTSTRTARLVERVERAHDQGQPFHRNQTNNIEQSHQCNQTTKLRQSNCQAQTHNIRQSHQCNQTTKLRQSNCQAQKQDANQSVNRHIICTKKTRTKTTVQAANRTAGLDTGPAWPLTHSLDGLPAGLVSRFGQLRHHTAWFVGCYVRRLGGRVGWWASGLACCLESRRCRDRFCRLANCWQVKCSRGQLVTGLPLAARHQSSISSVLRTAGGCACRLYATRATSVHPNATITNTSSTDNQQANHPRAFMYA
jgi:hypothetical protein